MHNLSLRAVVYLTALALSMWGKANLRGKVLWKRKAWKKAKAKEWKKANYRTADLYGGAVAMGRETPLSGYPRLSSVPK